MINKTIATGREVEITSGPGKYSNDYRITLHRSYKQDEWVTHYTSEDGSFHNGHYFPTYCEALLDYMTRCKTNNVEAFLP